MVELGRDDLHVGGNAGLQSPNELLDFEMVRLHGGDA
jgi:hypothetical protein